MNIKRKWCLLLSSLLGFCCIHMATGQDKNEERPQFNLNQDLLLVHYDCKTDVDDLHAVAAFATLLEHPDYEGLKYHAVAGTYGMQDGLYVPPNDLFELSFKGNWSDAHADFDKAVQHVARITSKQLKKKGNIWIAEAGQSNFSAAVIRTLVRKFPKHILSERIHLVQHSNWNEEVTSPEDLLFLKKTIDYQKIADGNYVGNDTPGFRTEEIVPWKQKITTEKVVEIWKQAIDLSHTYNGKEGRYTNEAILSGGLDFSDFSEVCWIFNRLHLKDVTDFFEEFGE